MSRSEAEHAINGCINNDRRASSRRRQQVLASKRGRAATNKRLPFCLRARRLAAHNRTRLPDRGRAVRTNTIVLPILVAADNAVLTWRALPAARQAPLSPRPMHTRLTQLRSHFPTCRRCCCRARRRASSSSSTNHKRTRPAISGRLTSAPVSGRWPARPPRPARAGSNRRPNRRVAEMRTTSARRRARRLPPR